MANYSDFLTQFISERGLTFGGTFTKEEVFAWFRQKYPERHQHFVEDQFLKKTTNYPGRVRFMPPPKVADDLFYAEDEGFTKFTLYQKGVHPEPYYKSGTQREETTAFPIPVAEVTTEVSISANGLLNNRYLIRSALGKGGFGQTYLAEDTHMPSRRLRVIKQLKSPSDDPKLYPLIRERFEREAATLERLGEGSDQIPTLHAYFSEGDEFYLVQDWVDGRSLTQRVRESGPFSEDEVREFLTSLLLVLEFVHSEGVIHRDIKPDNVMLRERDGRPVLIDFGAVKEVVTTVIDIHGFPSSTIVIGSPGYMPLEQQAGRPVFASDIFSLGLTAIFGLTGKHPQQLHDPRTGEFDWREHAPGVTQSLAVVLSMAVEENARNRFSSARQMLDALEASARPAAGRGGASGHGGERPGPVGKQSPLNMDTCRQLLREFQFDVDERQPPDDSRRGRFMAGWRDAAERGRVYNESTLRRLTWYNLGYRLGKKIGVRDAKDIDDTFRCFAREYNTPGGEPEGATTIISEETVLWRDSEDLDESSVLITEPVLLIRINQNYREGMSAEALYDATRGVWRVGSRRERARYAMAVYRGVVREVYAITGWHPAGTTQYATCDIENMRVPGRWEFIGDVAEDSVRDKYRGRSVASYFKRGQQNPVVYVNC